MPFTWMHKVYDEQYLFECLYSPRAFLPAVKMQSKSELVVHCTMLNGMYSAQEYTT